jgi:heme-degrading monooxygenase HmoA
MIARVWHGSVRAERADAYLEYLERTGLKDLATTPGCGGLQVLRRTEAGVTHYVLTTLWDSYEAIRRFAGDDYEQPRYYPEDDDFLLDREPRVLHYEVLLTDTHWG